MGRPVDEYAHWLDGLEKRIRQIERFVWPPHKTAEEELTPVRFVLLVLCEEAGPISRNALLRRTRLRAAALDQILAPLIEEGRAVTWLSPRPLGRPARYYCMAEKEGRWEL